MNGKNKKRNHHESMGLGCLGDREISLNFYHDNYGQLHLNRKLSEDITKAGLMKCYIQKSVDDRLFLVFEANKGQKVNRYSKEIAHCAICSSKVWKPILEKHHINEPGKYRIQLSLNLAKRADVMTFQIGSMFLLDDLQGVRAAAAMEHPEDSGIIQREEILVDIVKEQVQRDPDIETCIRVLKVHGYKVQKPVKRLDYVDV
jgi:hypothetical protein